MAYDQAWETKNMELHGGTSEESPRSKRGAAKQQQPKTVAANMDAFELYCRDVRARKLLSATQEIELAEQMSEARAEIRSRLFVLPATTEYVLTLAERLAAGEIAAREVIAGPAADEDSTAASRKEAFLEQARTLAKLYKNSKRAKNVERARKKVADWLHGMQLADFAVNGMRYKLDEGYDVTRRARRNLRRIAKRTGVVANDLLRAARHGETRIHAVIRGASGLRANGTATCDKLVRTVVEAKQSLDEVESVIGTSSEELQAQVEAIREAEARFSSARSHFVEANLRLVLSTARRYPTRGLSLADLVQEGNIALMHAVEKFDHRFGCRFSTYAVPWIRQALSRAVLRQGRVVRVTSYVKENVGRVRRATSELRDELDREPTNAEVAERAGIAEGRLVDFRGLPPESSVSLDEPLADDDSRTLLDLVEDTSIVPPADVTAERDLDARTLSALGALPEREREIVRLRFGLGDDGDHNLEEIGTRFGISRERVRQIEARALQRLRAIKR
jgi:RNA polymerase primary sigma factor